MIGQRSRSSQSAGEVDVVSTAPHRPPVRCMPAPHAGARRGEARMPRSCGSVQNYFRQVDFYPDLRRNQAVLEGMTIASARQGRQGRRQGPAGNTVVVHILYRAETDNLSDEQVASQIEVLN